MASLAPGESCLGGGETEPPNRDPVGIGHESQVATSMAVERLGSLHEPRDSRNLLHRPAQKHQQVGSGPFGRSAQVVKVQQEESHGQAVGGDPESEGGFLGGQAFDIDAVVAAPVANLILVETERHVDALAADPRW